MSDPVPARPWHRRALPRLGWLALLILLLALPLYVSQFWEQLGLFVFAAAIGAIGLNLITGSAGQLSLAHAFFLAIGAYGYAYLAGGQTGIGGGITVTGLNWPPLVAMIAAVALAGVVGLLFSPISSRLRGIYLGLASLALVFLGQHVLQNAKAVTGGFYGRNAQPFSLFGFSFTDDNPPLTVLNVPFGQLERLWYLGLVLLVLAYLFAQNLLRGRPGRALRTIRDNEIAAAVMGVPVRRYKAGAFVISSMYAGLAGVLIALAFQRPVPDYFGLQLSVTYLAMIVIGGLGSVRGAVAGAAFVTALPLILTHYSDSLTFLAQPGQSGVGPADFSNYVYGGAVILVLLLQKGGLAGLVVAVRDRFTVRPAAPDPRTNHEPGPTGSTSSESANKEAHQI
ncbi:branched-chain amino acid ABC transporter permease [Amycolatopsis benzoatilytica]|uniref:branched-chain amino acid ABC transporter permease n=1 Tax=Amycolatopsis benzoatilytica TaxID=346045 RepID=UPI00036A773D|nr:branched-chain amino acid ABC transporter permease [Amycolatopsis benzoatilytica]